jgi:hypothetical protein
MWQSGRMTAAEEEEDTTTMAVDRGRKWLSVEGRLSTLYIHPPL